MSSSYYSSRRVSSGVFPSQSYAQMPRYSSFSDSSALRRSSSTSVFGTTNRTYLPSSYYKPSYNRYSVVGSTPRVSDRYPYVRYSSAPLSDTTRYAYGPDYSLIRRSSLADRPSQYAYKTGGYLDTALNSKLRVSPYYGASADCPRPPARNYVKFMDIDDAVELYKHRFLTSGALSKYWLSPRRMYN